jgi:NADH-quinone oxidoreductase subunit N
MIVATLKGPHMDWSALSPLLALFGGATLTLLTGLLRPRFARHVLVPVFAIAALGAAMGLSIWQWHRHADIVAAALRIDGLALALMLLIFVGGIATVLLSWRAAAPVEAAHGEYFALLLTSIAGMALLVESQNTITLFVAFELLSIPLYVLCATEMRRATSLEAGLKYLIVGSVGSATLVYGLAMLYGATGSTDFNGIATAVGSSGIGSDVLFLTGIALVLAGLAFKASVAPFHQWTPDVYEGAPTPITAFMAVATKAAAFGVLLRLFDVALIDTQADWGPIMAALATTSIVVGNVGALTQTSLKRLLAWSSVAQAGYMLAGVVVSTQLGVKATVFYLGVYLAMNIAAFAVIVARERETVLGDHIDSVAGIGATRPWLAWPMTIAMLSLAGLPATGGFIGKIYLIDAIVDGGYTWLAVVLVVGSMISLAYYLRVVAAVWTRPAVGTELTPASRGPGGRPALAGGAEAEAEGTRGSEPEVLFVAVVFAALTLAAGIVPSPLFDFARHAGRALTGLF